MITHKLRNKLKDFFDADKQQKQKLIDDSNLNRRTVNYILSGRHKNNDLLELALKIYDETLQKIKERENKYNEQPTQQ